MPIELWIQSIQNVWDREKKANYYLTSSSAVMPSLRYFKAPEQETGSEIIELKFNPIGKAGFVARPKIAAHFYEVDKAQSEKYFSSSSSSIPERDFHFDKIAVNDMEIPYNNYFQDLISDIGENPVLTPLYSDVSSTSSQTVMTHNGDLGSPRLNILMRGASVK
jgi:hypothetical protein